MAAVPQVMVYHESNDFSFEKQAKETRMYSGRIQPVPKLEMYVAPRSMAVRLNNYSISNLFIERNGIL
jgi:hypothetical protein